MDWDIIDIFNFDMDARELDVSIRSILLEESSCSTILLPDDQPSEDHSVNLLHPEAEAIPPTACWKPSNCTTPPSEPEDSDQDSGHCSEVSEEASSVQDMAIGSDAENDVPTAAAAASNTCESCGLVIVPSATASFRPSGGRCESCREQLNSDKNDLRPFRCAICSKAFRLSSTLSAHKKLHDHGGPSLRCETCGRAFKQPSALSSHRHLHQPVRPHGCGLCGKQFVRLHALKTHVLSHANERPFACDQCGKAFAEKHVLVRHRKTHSDERPHGCSECSKRFKERYDLLRHSLIHSGLRPHKCPDCSMTFVQSNALAKHRKCHERRRHREPSAFRVGHEGTACC